MIKKGDKVRCISDGKTLGKTIIYTGKWYRILNFDEMEDIIFYDLEELDGREVEGLWDDSRFITEQQWRDILLSRILEE